MPDFEYKEQTKVDWKTIVIPIMGVVIMVLLLFIAMVASGGIHLNSETGNKKRVSPYDLETVTVTKALIKLPDGTTTEINVAGYKQDNRYHTDMITIIDDTGKSWIIDSDSVVFTGDPTK